MDINYDGDLSKTRTCFRKNTTVFLKTHTKKLIQKKILKKTPRPFLFKITNVFLKNHDRVKNSQVKYTVSYLFSRVHFMVTHPLLVEG